MRPSSTAFVDCSTLGYSQEPLLAQIRLDGHVAALAVADVMHVVLDLQQQAQLVQFFHHGFARFHAVHAGKVRAGLRGHAPVRADHDGQRQVVARGHCVVGRIVGGGHLDTARAELRVHQFIGDDGNGLVPQRQQAAPSDNLLIARIVRVHRHGLIAQHCFRAGGGHHQELTGLGLALVVEQRILQVPQLALFLHHLDLLVGEGGAGGGVPVHHALAAVDEALLIQLHEDLLHATRVGRVHGEPLPRPIARAAQLLELLDDDAAVLLLPGPDLFEEFLPAQVVAVLHHALLAERLFHHGLRGDAGVVGAGQPEHFLAVHARLAGKDVLDGVVEHVPHVQHARDVGRRDDDGVAPAWLTRGWPRSSSASARSHTTSLLPPAVRKPWGFQTYPCKSVQSVSQRRISAYSRLSTSAWRLASMILSFTPTVPHSSLPSVDWISTRVRALVPVEDSRMRTL